MAGSTPLVVCLPPAGGSAATFRPWLRGTGPERAGLELQVLNVRLLQGMSGGSPSARQAPSERDGALLDLAVAIADQLPVDRPFVLVGHSLGGLLAFEAAVELQRRGRPLPACVLVMGSRPPHNSSAELFAPLIDLPDELFLDALEEAGAVNAALRASPMRPLFLPALRADLRIITTYRPDTAARRQDPLLIPVVAWCGSRDPLAPASLLSGWKDYTVFPRPAEVFVGGHFFPFEEAHACLPALEALCAHLVPPCGHPIGEHAPQIRIDHLPPAGTGR